MSEITIMPTEQLNKILFKLDDLYEQVKQMNKDRENNTSVWMTTE
jgi:hypothetical protein